VSAAYPHKEEIVGRRVVIQVTCLHHATEKLSGDMGRYYIDIGQKVV